MFLNNSRKRQDYHWKAMFPSFIALSHAESKGCLQGSCPPGTVPPDLDAGSLKAANHRDMSDSHPLPPATSIPTLLHCVMHRVPRMCHARSMPDIAIPCPLWQWGLSWGSVHVSPLFWYAYYLVLYGDYKGVWVTAWPLGSATASRSDTGQITTAEQNTKPWDKYVHLQKTVPTAPKTGPAPRYLIGLPALSCLGRLHGLGAFFFFFQHCGAVSGRFPQKGWR